MMMAIPATLSAQGKELGDYVIRDPQAWGFMKYGAGSQDLYTGTVGVIIPLYTYSDPDFELPISLAYSSNGFMPNVQPGPVGLGWILDAGGYITRNVRGIRDNDPGAQGSTGVLHGYLDYVSVDSPDTSPVLERPYSSIDVPSSSISAEYCYSRNGTLYETRSDIYSFRFAGISGKFVIKENGTAAVYDCSIPAGRVKVDLSGLDAPLFKSSITIKTGDGYEYVFGGLLGRDDNSLYNTVTPWTSGQGPEGALIDRDDIWYLKEIIAPNRRTVRFSYELHRSGTMIPRGGRSAMSIGYAPTGTPHGYYIGGNSQWNDYYLQLDNYTALLSSIEIGNACKMVFRYENRPAEKALRYNITESSLNTVPRLSEISILDITSDSEKILHHSTLQHRFGSGNPTMMLSSVNIDGVGTYTMQYHGEDGDFPRQGCLQLDHWGYYNSSGVSLIADLLPQVSVDANYKEHLTGNSREPDHSKTMLGMLEKVTYPTGGWTEYAYEPRTYDAILERDETTGGKPELKSCPEKNGGGVRICRITERTADGIVSEKRFLYSQGNMLSFPRYSHKVLVSSQVSEVSINNLTVTTAAYAQDGTYIEYGEVREVFPDSSYVIHRFRNHRDTPDIMTEYEESTTWLGATIQQQTFIKPSPATAEAYFREYPSRSVLRGKKSGEYYYSKDGALLQEHLYEYADTDHGTTPFAAVTAGCRYEGRFLYYYGDVTKVTLKTYGPDGTVSTKISSYAYDSNRQLKRESVTDSDGKTYSKYRFYINSIYPPVRTPAENAMFSRSILAFPIYESEALTDADGTRLTAAKHYVYIQAGPSFVLHKVEEANIPDAYSYGETVPVNLDYRTVRDFGGASGYNSFLRPCFETDRNGIQSIMIWSNEGLWPLALVRNCSLEKASDVGISATSTYGWESLTPTQESALRNIPGVSVTIWKHVPFIGVSNKVGPEARGATYGYDSSGRLQSVRDSNGDIRIEYGYGINETL